MKNPKSNLTKIAVALTIAITFLVPNGVLAQGAAKNVIVMISDGCGYGQIDATSIYQYGRTGVQIYELFPIRYAMSTYSAGNFNEDGSWQYQGSYDPEQAWNWFNYVKSGYTDSASAATAMSTGIKTYDAGIGVDSNKNRLKHVSERAEELGKATGVITSVEFSHATPAGFVAHNVSRNNYAEIAQEMILDSKADVIMGCGNPMYDDDGNPSTESSYKYVGGETTWNGLMAGLTDFDVDGDGVPDNSVEDADGDGMVDAWVLVQELEDFQALMSGPTPKRVIGVPKVYQTLQYNRSSLVEGEGGEYSGAEGEPYSDPFVPGVPTLEEMTKASLNILDNDPDGFFLMIEGGAIDWASHGNSSGRMIEEEIDFNRSVEAVVDWVHRNSSWDETLLIVTGDHECGYLTGSGSGPDDDDPNDLVPAIWNPIVNNGAGNLPGMEWHSGDHTNSLIPFFAKGVGSDLFVMYADEHDTVRGTYIDNIEIAEAIFELMSMPGVDYSNVFFMQLKPGLNMVSLPLKPKEDYTARSFAELLGATVVIKVDEQRQKFVGYVPDSSTNDFTIEGGKGYIVNVEQQNTVPFVGAAWTNLPSYEAAPGLTTDSAWAFAVSGTLNSPLGLTMLESYTVRIRNLRTGIVTTESVSASGQFVLAFADLSRNDVVQVYDELEITAMDASGNLISRVVRVIDADNIRQAHLRLPLYLGGIIPVQTALLQSYPNPFNPETWIPYQLSEDSDVRIRIYDVQGRLVRTFDLGRRTAGIYSTKDKALLWDGRNNAGEVVGSGVYFYELQAGKFSRVKRMIILK